MVAGVMIASRPASSGGQAPAPGENGLLRGSTDLETSHLEKNLLRLTHLCASYASIASVLRSLALQGEQLVALGEGIAPSPWPPAPTTASAAFLMHKAIMRSSAFTLLLYSFRSSPRGVGSASYRNCTA